MATQKTAAVHNDGLHYHGGAGLHGCLYQDGPHIFETYEDAVGYFVDNYGLGRNRARRLARDGYLELNMRRGGNEYMEITECCETECREGDEEEDDGIMEGDIVTTDREHWYQDGRLYCVGNEQALKSQMDDDQYWPSVWWVSDHGNPHLLTLGEGQ